MVLAAPQQLNKLSCRLDEHHQGSSSHLTHKEHIVLSQHHISSNKQTKGLNPWKLKKVARWSSPDQEEKGRHQKLTRRTRAGRSRTRRRRAS
jgi:hypothetical protein